MSVEHLILFTMLGLWAGSALGYLAATPYPDEMWESLVWLPATIIVVIIFCIIAIVRLPYLLAIELYERIRDRFR